MRQVGGPIPGHEGAAVWMAAAGKAGRLPQALLVSGVPGLGKERLAMELSAWLLCERPDGASPCGRCRSCHLMAAGTHPDFLRLSPEAEGKVLGIDAVREGCSFTAYTPQVAARRVLLLLPAEALAPAAANAFLKTLEEPPAHAHMILVTAAATRILPTIRSRLQILSMEAPPEAATERWMRGQGVPEADARTLVRLAGGRPLRAWEWWEEGYLERRRHWVEAFLAIPREGPAAVIDLATRWGKEESFTALWEAIAAIVADLARLAFAPHADIRNLDYMESLEALAGHVEGGAILDLEARWRRLPLERQQHRNLALLVEGPLMAWWKMARGGRGDG